MSTRWQCDVVEIKPGLLGGIKAAELKDALTRMGAQGWELVSVACPAPLAPILAVFKKPA